MRPKVLLLALLPSCLLAALRASVVTAGNKCLHTPITIGVSSDFNARMARDAQPEWVRIDMRWREINPAPCVRDVGDGTVVDTGFGLVTHAVASSGRHFVENLIFDLATNPSDALVGDAASIQLIDVP